ncbi:Gfo/Idh/MocA family oxidoreductase [Candidatus Aerophobetes bacterium]|nr:Gfo/Idh/MocA family oxidoreductase [Candidatus Aerophobetes bacterium]
MAKELGFGVIGCGVITPWHIYGIIHTEGAKLIAVSDMVEERAKKVAQENKVDWYSDYRKMLERDDIDVVNICTPSGTHGEIAIEAAKAGKHIIVEKPMEITLEKCDEMISACRKANVKLEVIFQSRFLPSVKKLKKAINEGKLGKLVLGDMYNKWYRSQEYYDSGKWRGTWKLDGGGALMNQAIHGVDLLQYIMGPVDSLYAYTKTLARKIEVEDTATAVVNFKNGALGVIEATTSVYPGFSRKLEIHGERGTVIIEDEKITRWEFQGEKSKIKEETEEKKTGTSAKPTAMGKEGHRVQIEEMVKAIRENREPLVNGEEGRKAVEIILGIYKSSRTGRSIKFPLK